MGYTHYWYREREITPELYDKIVEDFKSLLPTFKVLDVKLGDGLGENSPVLDTENVFFNGLSKCGHKANASIVIPWPADKTKFGSAPSSDQALVGSWFAGALLDQRTCNGDCSYETFALPRVFSTDGYFSQNDEGRYFAFCKTAFRPYDLAVTTFLVIAKHYLGDKIDVSSDGEMQHWIDAVMMCETAFGYGNDFRLQNQGMQTVIETETLKLHRSTLEDWTYAKLMRSTWSDRSVSYEVDSNSLGFKSFDDLGEAENFYNLAVGDKQ